MERFQQCLYIAFLLLLSLHKNNWVPTYDMLEEAGYLWFLLIATEMFVGIAFPSFPYILFIFSLYLILEFSLIE